MISWLICNDDPSLELDLHQYDLGTLQEAAAQTADLYWQHEGLLHWVPVPVLVNALQLMQYYRDLNKYRAVTVTPPPDIGKIKWGQTSEITSRQSPEWFESLQPLGSLPPQQPR